MNDHPGIWPEDTPPIPSGTTDWDARFMELARHVGAWSKDPGRKIGAVVVGPAREVRAIAYNGLPRGLDDAIMERRIRPVKYSWSEHAERNAIYNAARIGMPLEGCTIYVNWFPCTDCARAVVQSGIKTLVALRPDFAEEKWGSEFSIAMEMLTEAGVLIRWQGDMAARSV
jgi:dCMP deaminase